MIKHTSSEILTESFSILARAIMYVILVVACAELIYLDARQHSSEERFSEYSYTELAQSVVLLVALSISVYSYVKATTFKSAAIVIATQCTVALFREQDAYFEQHVGSTTWMIPVVLTLLLSAYLLFRHRAAIRPELTRYASTLSAGIFFAGICTVFVFSRLFGRSTFWKAVMDGEYQRTAKAAAEECVELYGYLLILLSVIELYLSTVQTQRQVTGSVLEMSSTKIPHHKK